MEIQTGLAVFFVIAVLFAGGIWFNKRKKKGTSGKASGGGSKSKAQHK